MQLKCSLKIYIDVMKFQKQQHNDIVNTGGKATFWHNHATRVKKTALTNQKQRLTSLSGETASLW